MKERVQKLMAQADIGSRRACEELIRQGRVRVNGATIELGAQADPTKDIIELDGTKLSFASKLYIALYKPMNVLSTNEGHKGDDRKTVRELVPHEGHLFTIGRLDAESEGLMVLTNDGAMANKLSHPRYGHTKTYKVIVYGLPSGETLEKWRSGVYLEEGKTAPCVVEVSSHGGGLATLKIVMKEGKKRQIRRIASMLGHPVKRLIRTHIGRLNIGKLRTGEWYEMSAAEVTALQTPAEKLKVIRQESRRAPSVKSKSNKSPTKKPFSAKTPQRKKTGKSDTGRSRKR